jgi:hypothetical protein
LEGLEGFKRNSLGRLSLVEVLALNDHNLLKGRNVVAMKVFFEYSPLKVNQLIVVEEAVAIFVEYSEDTQQSSFKCRLERLG